MKNKMIPAYSCESGGAPMEPANTFDKVPVLPISEPTGKKTNKETVCIFCGSKDRSMCFCLECEDSHFLQVRVHNSKGAVVTSGGHQSGTETNQKNKTLPLQTNYICQHQFIYMAQKTKRS